MTHNMSEFINKNRKHKIMSGGHVTKDGKPINKPQESKGVEYSFSDGATMTVWKKDVQSAPDYMPIWDL